MATATFDDSPVPVVRAAPYPPGTRLPRYWFDDSAFLSHSANALNLLFPLGERFFVRSVRRYLDDIADPKLRERVRGFSGQEMQHGRGHEAAFEALRAQGYDIEGFLRRYERLAFGVIEPLAPPLLRLSVTVALEHLTATLAEDTLTRDWMDRAHPAMADLLRWHAVEEIEHKSVAFDVLAAVDDRYVVRVAGMALGVGLLVLFWRAGAEHLLRQDPWLTPERLRREQREAADRGHGRDFLWRAFASYLRPGFHPDAHPTRHLAESWIAAHGARLAGAAHG